MTGRLAMDDAAMIGPESQTAGGGPAGETEAAADTKPRLHLNGAVWVVVIWLVYLATMSFIARGSLAENDFPARGEWRQGVVRNEPTWARWDSFWYAHIAEDGYVRRGNEQSGVAFFPMYPLVMGAVSDVLGVEPLTAGLWISRLSVLVALMLLLTYARSQQLRDPWAPLFALLAYPMSFILISVYSEALFLACILGAFVAVTRGRYLIAIGPSVLAGFTRAHALAAAPALLIVVFLRWRRGETGRWGAALGLLPISALLVGPAVLSVAFYFAYGDPLLYLHSHAAWNQKLTMPWVTAARLWNIIWQAWSNGEWAPLASTLQLVAALGLLVGTVALLWLRRWAEATFVGIVLGLQMISGQPTSLHRFITFCFPLFLLLGQLSRHRRVWTAYLLAACLCQGVMALKFVHYLQPNP